MRKNVSRVLFGITAIGAAVLLLGNMLNWWSISANGWWAVFIIVPGIAGMIETGVHFWNLFLTLLGVCLYLNAQDLLKYFPREVLFIALLVILGLYLIFKPTKSCNIGKFEFNESDKFDNVIIDEGEVSKAECLFSNINVTPNGTLSKGKYSCTFGSLSISLEKVIITNNCKVKLDNVFGTTKIFTYGKCRVVVDGSPVFGAIEDKSAGKNNMALPVLKLKCSSVFGSVEIL